MLELSVDKVDGELLDRVLNVDNVLLEAVLKVDNVLLESVDCELLDKVESVD